MLLAQIVNGVAIGATYALVAVAVVLVFTGTRVLSIAMGEIGGLGLFLALRWQTNGIPGLGWHPGPLAVAAIAIVIGALVGLAVERLVVRPLVQRPPFDGLIATLGVALTLALFELAFFGANPLSVESPVGTGSLHILGASIFAPLVVALILAAVVAGGLYLVLSRTPFGLTTRATVSDPTVARLLGVKVTNVYRFVWAIGGALSGAAAALSTPSTGALSPFGPTKFALAALAGAVIGGLDSLGGAILGSILVGIVQSVAEPRIGVGQASGCVLALVLITLMVRPQGLLGKAGVR